MGNEGQETPVMLQVLMLLIAALIGYLFGVIRDYFQRRAEKRARHEERTLDAVSDVLRGARRNIRANRDLTYAVIEMRLAHEGAYGEGKAEHLRIQNERRQKAFTDLDDARAIYEPAHLKLDVLSPTLATSAEQLLLKASPQSVTLDKQNAESQEFEQAEKALIAAVCRELKIKRAS